MCVACASEVGMLSDEESGALSMLAVGICTAGGRALAVRGSFDKESEALGEGPSSVYTVEATEEGRREGVGK